MESKWMIAIFLFIAIVVNVAIAQKWLPYNFTYVNLLLIGVFVFIFLINKKMDTPKSLLDSLRTAREFYSQAFYGDKKNIEIDDIVEVSRQKDAVRATKKGVVHDIVIKNKEGKEFLLKDDAYMKHNPASIVFMGKLGTVVPEFYKSKAELERELRYIPKPEEKKKIERKVKVERKERAESAIPATL